MKLALSARTFCFLLEKPQQAELQNKFTEVSFNVWIDQIFSVNERASSNVGPREQNSTSRFRFQKTGLFFHDLSRHLFGPSFAKLNWIHNRLSLSDMVRNSVGQSLVVRVYWCRLVYIFKTSLNVRANWPRMHCHKYCKKVVCVSHELSWDGWVTILVIEYMFSTDDLHQNI